MGKKELLSFLGWSTVINFGLIAVTFILHLLANDLIYQVWNSLYSVSPETYDLIMISFFGLWKILVIFFNVIPYIVLRYCMNKS